MSWIWPEYTRRDRPLTKERRKAIQRDAWKAWWANKSNLVLYLTFCALLLLAVVNASDVGGWVATSVGASGFTHRLFRAVAPALLRPPNETRGAADFSPRDPAQAKARGSSRRVLLSALTVTSVGVLHTVFGRYRFAPCVYGATRWHGYDVCLNRGYWLEGLDDGIMRCPECGAEREALPPTEAA